jgi:hypothetical protein
MAERAIYNGELVYLNLPHQLHVHDSNTMIQWPQANSLHVPHAHYAYNSISLLSLAYACMIRMIKSRRVRWAGQVAHMGEKRNAYRILVGSQKERDHYEDLSVKIILKWFLER